MEIQQLFLVRIAIQVAKNVLEELVLNVLHAIILLTKNSFFLKKMNASLNVKKIVIIFRLLGILILLHAFIKKIVNSINMEM
jgi:hypothetical protein